MRGFWVGIFVFLNILNLGAQSPRLNEFVDKLKLKSYSNDVRLLKHTLSAAHREYLKKYKAYAEVSDAFALGYFDCLSGTIIMSEIFDQLNLKYKIVETNYHIFLIVNTTEGDAIVETTDLYNGLLTDRAEIDLRLKHYREFGKNSSLYLSKFDIFQEVPKEQLEGLVFFNRSVVQFLQQNFESAVSLLEKASAIYNGPRISAFSKVVIRQILSDNSVDENHKFELLAKLDEIISEPLQVTSVNF